MHTPPSHMNCESYLSPLCVCVCVFFSKKKKKKKEYGFIVFRKYLIIIPLQLQ